MSNPKLLTTIVNKAYFNMGDAETLEEFSDAMRSAARDMYSTADWIWIAQISPEKVVVSVDSTSSYTYFEHSWTIEAGKPKLSSDSTEVTPETEYKPKRG